MSRTKTTKAKRKPSAKSKAVATKTEAKAKTVKSGGHSVAIVGGGISGLAAAIKLQKAGFQVTLFERHNRLGGNMSSEDVNGVEHDVYPHMFCDWYDNFWDLFENDLGLSRSAHFDPRAGLKMLREGSETYEQLFNPTTLEAIIANLKSGAMSPAEMFLMGYSMLDLAGYPFNREGYAQLDKLSVNGFLYSQSTTTEQIAEMENYILQVIWSIQSEHTSAETYQDFLRHTLSFPNGAPFAHMLKGSLQDGLIAPIQQLLERLGTTIKLETSVTSVRLEGDVPRLHWRKQGSSTRMQSGRFDQVIIAVPADPLTDFIMGGPDDLPGDRIIDREPSLAQVRRLRSVPIPVIDLYLNKKLSGFPAENIGLTGAQYGLSVVDISQLWQGQDFDGKTALVVAASDGESLPGHDFSAQAWFMLQELTRYYPGINIGSHWGDPDSDIDWDKTHARSNTDYGLFLNDVGSWDWMPDTAYPQTLPNVVFAGDLCRGNVNMATIEGAVESGVLAAAAVQRYDALAHAGKPLGQPIELIKHVTYGNTALRAAKIALMPFAYAAKGWTLIGQNNGKPVRSGDGLHDLGNALQSEHLSLLPMQYVVDWWTTAYWFWYSVFEPDEGDAPVGASNHNDDEFIGLGAAMLMTLGEFASYASDQCKQSGSAGGRQADSSEPMGAARNVASSLGRIISGAMSGAAKSESANISPRKRRWRPKP